MSAFYVKSDVEEIVHKIKDFAHFFEGKNILMTGGGGFLGRYFSAVFTELNQKVFKTPCNVTMLDNFITTNNPAYQERTEANVKYEKFNVITPYKYEGKLDYIIHAAGIASPFYYRAFPIETMDVGVSGTRNMLELAKEKKAALTFFSSSEIYGDPDPKYVPTAESYKGSVSCTGPRSCYDESKRLGETMCYVYHNLHGLHTNTIRPFNVYGPGMQENDYRVLPNFASRIKSGLPLHVYGTGNQTRTFCYITDAMAGFLAVIAKGVPGEPYNIGNPKPEISMEGLVRTIEDVIGKKLKVDIINYPDSYPADEPNRRCPDITKAKTQLNFAPNVDLNMGLKRFLTWTNENFKGEI